MTDVVQIFLRLSRKNQDPRVQQVLNWYDQRPIGMNGKRSGIQEHILQAVSIGLSQMGYGAVAGVQSRRKDQGSVESQVGSTTTRKRASDKKTTSPNGSKNTAMKKVAARMKF